jgi:small subunit ribosomal protein S6
MKRSYEIPVIFRNLGSEDEMQQAIDQVVAWIENSNEMENPGNVTRIDRTRLGRRRLAYEINGQREGIYVLFYADVDAAHLTELELNLKLYDPVLRHMVVRDESPATTTETEEEKPDSKASDEPSEPEEENDEDSDDEEETNADNDSE